MRDLISIVIVAIIGLIGIGILLSLAFWAMNNIGFLIIVLVILFVIAFFFTKSDY